MPAYEVRHARGNLNSEKQEPHRQVGATNGLSSICHLLTSSTPLISFAALHHTYFGSTPTFPRPRTWDQPLFFQNKNANLAIFQKLFRLADSATMEAPYHMQGILHRVEQSWMRKYNSALLRKIDGARSSSSYGRDPATYSALLSSWPFQCSR